MEKIYRVKLNSKGMPNFSTAVEIADRPQGEWIPSDTDGFVCSVCKNGYRNQPTLMGRPMFEYCPVCGARMFAKDTNVPNKKGAGDETNNNKVE